MSQRETTATPATTNPAPGTAAAAAAAPAPVTAVPPADKRSEGHATAAGYLTAFHLLKDTKLETKLLGFLNAVTDSLADKTAFVEAVASLFTARNYQLVVRTLTNAKATTRELAVSYLEAIWPDLWELEMDDLGRQVRNVPGLGARDLDGGLTPAVYRELAQIVGVLLEHTTVATPYLAERIAVRMFTTPKPMHASEQIAYFKTTAGRRAARQLLVMELQSEGYKVHAPTTAPTTTQAATLTTTTTQAATQAATPAAPTVKRPLVPANVDPLLLEILQKCRAVDSPSEREFHTQWLPSRLRTYGFEPINKAGNIVVVVPTTTGELSTVLYSCHTDTCHTFGASAQKLCYDAVRGEIFLDKSDKTYTGCLGADDGVGVWIMLRMVSRKIPGTYVFHYGEERGCRGSKEMARTEQEFLKRHTHSIAFDRPGTTEVITHQMGRQRMASDEFGKSLAGRLAVSSGGRLALHVSDRGVVTDNAQYADHIREVVNLAVGYRSQHSESEVLDYAFAQCMADAVCDALCEPGLKAAPLPLVNTCAAPRRVHTGGWGVHTLLEDDPELEVGSRGRPAAAGVKPPVQSALPFPSRTKATLVRSKNVLRGGDVPAATLVDCSFDELMRVVADDASNDEIVLQLKLMALDIVELRRENTALKRANRALRQMCRPES